MPSVVLAEPDAATSELYQRALQQNFTVRTAADEQQLLHLLAGEPIAAVVLEPNCFGEQAWQAVARIAADCRDHGTVLVICSTQDERRRGYELGVHEYLLKPTLPEVLTARVAAQVQVQPAATQA
jgi:DNA-binding response OmpR family regulator